MSKKTSSCHSKKMAASPAPSPATTDAGSGTDATSDATKGAATGAAAGIGLWGLAMPIANAIGFTTSGIAGGSTAASMMSAAAVANGGGVASGSTVAILQSVGAVGLATPIGLGLVAGGAAVGGAAFFVKSKLSRPSQESETEATEVEGEEKGLWVLVQILPGSLKPTIRTFDGECKARNAFLDSPASSKALFDPEQKRVLDLGWKYEMDEIVGGGKKYM